MPREKKNFRQFLEDLNTIGRSYDNYSNVVTASQFFHAFYANYSRMAQQQGYIKEKGGVWIVTTKGDDFIRQLKGDFT